MIRRPGLALLALLTLCACGGDPVEQINVTVPAGISVPENMAYIPAGPFIMGSDKDPKTRLGVKVELPHFIIDRYEVTKGDFQKFRKNYFVPSGKEAYPASEMTFDEAAGYCRAQGKRLPKEAEWEKAARGTDRRKWPWGLYQDHPNNGFSGFLPEKVDAREEWISPYGVYGMGHNVWEWIDDDWDYNGMPGSERGKYKVIRGGLYQSHLKIDFSATYQRNFMNPSARYNFLGFRCAKSLS